MTRRRTDVGLHIITNGKDVSENVLPWSEFLERVHTAAQKPKRAPRGKPVTPRTTAPPELHNVPPERRCAFVHTKSPRQDQQCGSYAMTGARRCHKHGGYRENPEHPATVRRLGDIMTRQAALEAGAELRTLPPKARALVEQHLTDAGLPTRAAVVLEGVRAYLAEDNGKAWRRWMSQAKAARPSEGMHARRRQNERNRAK